MKNKTYTRKKRRELVQKAVSLLASGYSQRKAADTLHVPHNTLRSWLKKLDAEGRDIETAFDEPVSKGGRPPALTLTDEEQCIAKWYRLAKESVDVAAWFFCRDDRVSLEVRNLIESYEEAAIEKSSRIAWPMSVRRSFHVTAEEKSAFRGKKASQQTEMITRRGMFEILADGSTRDIQPGEVWELDDYSTNQPYTYSDAQTGEIHVCRQVLAARDLCSAAWLGFEHIGRERDAYRGEDILRFIERLIASFGMPKVLRLERGSWESSSVHGIEVDGLTERWGDLRAIMRIEHVFKSKSKSIVEGGFNVLQRWLSHTGTDIGRHRGEFEEAAKRLRQSKSTKADPRKLGFLAQKESSELHAAAGTHLNTKQMHRSHLNERVSPDDLIARAGWHTSTVPENEVWRFLPCKQNRIVRAGQVKVSPGGGWPPMEFTVNGTVNGIHLENGHRVLIACDPSRPDLGAYVCNADSTVKNRQSYGMGEFLMTAPCHGLAPQFNASKMLSPHMLNRRTATAAATTTFRSIANAGVKKITTETTRTNGQSKLDQIGNIERNNSAPQPAPPIAGRKKKGEPSVSVGRQRGLETADKRKAEIEKLTKQYTEE